MSKTALSEGESKALNIVLWILSGLVCASLLMPGLTKLGNLEGRTLDVWRQLFERWGLPTFLVPIVGVTELASGVLLMVRQLAPFAGVAVTLVMIGAMLTHLLNDELRQAPVPLVIAILASFVAWCRWHQNAPMS